jgi:hypothetical protein
MLNTGLIIDLYFFPFVINEVEAALVALVEKVLQSDISVDSAYPVLTNYLNSHSYIFGAAFAFSPEIQQASTFVFRGRNGLVKKDIIAELEYTKADWYAVPVKMGKAVWNDTSFDIGYADGSFVMTTYSIPLYQRDFSFICVLTLKGLQGGLNRLQGKEFRFYGKRRKGLALSTRPS